MARLGRVFYGDSMDRQTVYPGQILPETTLLQMTKDAMISVAKLSSAVLGTSTIANGFAVTPTGPASLQVACAPGEIYSMASIDALAFSSLPADTTHAILKQGILLDGVTLSCPVPGTTGQSINYLIQVTYQDTDSTPVLLPYYNSANPALPYSGMGNNGLTQNTVRKGSAIVAVKAGASATTGSQVTPAPDAGYIGLYVVTVAFGQTTITAPSISQYASAPLLPSGLLQSIQNGNTSFAIDTGTANTYICNFTPAITARNEGLPLRFKVKTSNTGASTFNDGLGAVALVGGAHVALQGNELIANGDAWVQWNSSIGGGSYILLLCTGAPEQVAPATQSQHAMQLGQAVGRLINVQRFATPGTFTYTPTPGTSSVVVEVQGGGGGGGGVGATTASTISAAPGGNAGAYGKSRITSGFSGVSIVVGATGLGRTGLAGTNGGFSSFGSFVTSPGGEGGLFYSAATPPIISINSTTQSVSSGGNLVAAAGGRGAPANATVSSGGGSGDGGLSVFGAGAPCSPVVANTLFNGNTAICPGAGGSGATSTYGAGAAGGGHGAAGIVIVWEYA